MADKRLRLENWKLEYNGGLLPAAVPGDVTADLMAAGVISDALYADNYKSIDWVHRRDWTYLCRFHVTEEQFRSERLELVFYGVDTFSEVSVNGVSVGETDNMFLRFVFDIKKAARRGDNEIRVTFSAIRDVERRYENRKYGSCFNENRIFLRKAQCHFGWDWAPDFPGQGIYDNVELSWGDGKNIESVQVHAFNDGAASFITELSYSNRKEDRPDAVTVRVEKTPGAGLANGYETTVDALGGKCIANVYVEEPQLWYPVGYGSSPLYEYEVTLLYPGGESRVRGKFAFRSFTVSERPYAADRRDFAMSVNGSPFRAIGSNWVPASVMTGCVDEARYDKLLRAAREAGINMLRVWGGGLYEKDAFYDKCDEYGICVWQDFMFSCCDVPDDIPAFCDVIRGEAAYQIKRLRNHPCLAIWCGGNELTDSFRSEGAPFGKYVNRVMLAGLTQDLDGTRKYVWDSPYSLTDVGNDANSGDCHKNALSVATAHDDIRNFRRYQWDNDNAFDTECAVLGMSRVRSLKKFMPPDRIWPQNELWEDRFSCNPYDDSVVSFTERMNKNVEAMFGGADGLCDYVKKSMTVHAEVLRGEIEYFRSDRHNYGVMNWMYNDIWGNGTWAIVDYYGEKKPAYYAMKRAGKRRILCFVQHRDGYRLHAINDTAEPFSGIVQCMHQKLDGAVLSQRSWQIDVPAFGQDSVPVEFDETVKDAYLYACCGEEDAVYFYDLWRDKRFATDIETKISVAADGKSGVVEMTARSFARMVFIDFPEGAEPVLCDNYFDLPKGKRRAVPFRTGRAVTAGDIKVLTFADEWPE